MSLLVQTLKQVLQYHNTAKIQRESAEFLIEQINNFFTNRNFTNIIDIGCGSGILCNKLVETYPKSKVFGIDKSAAAVEFCRQNYNMVNCILEDIESNFLTKVPTKNSLFTTNFVLHWLENPSKIIEYLLRTQNCIAFAIILDGSLQALQNYLQSQDVQTGIGQNYLTRDAIEHLMQKYHMKYTITLRQYSEKVDNVVDYLGNNLCKIPNISSQNSFDKLRRLAANNTASVAKYNIGFILAMPA
jgi:trans-aconitate methyltransferase